MKQERIDSVLESLTNIAIGAGVALITQVLWFGVLDKEFSWYEHLGTTAVFTIVSFIRSYYIRRAFNGKSVYKTIKEKVL